MTTALLSVVGLGLGTVLVGLMAGLYVAFSVAVVPGIRRVDDTTFVATVHEVNLAIQNPAFGVCFAGALIVPAAASVSLLVQGSYAAGWALTGTIAYAAGLLLTLIVNVPLNQQLARDQDDAPAARLGYERPWNRAHAARTTLSVVALALLVIALIWV